MMRRLLCVALAFAPAWAAAQLSPDSPMVRALREGHASAAVPDSPTAQSAVQRIREHTKHGDEVTIEFFRMLRFQAQPSCARIVFGLYQKSSGTFWGQFGGQLNICEDGAPPRRQCAGKPTLVSPFSRCSDGSVPVETAEVKQAIDNAVESGSLTAERFLEQQAKDRSGTGSAK